MTSVTTKKLSYIAAKDFRDSFTLTTSGTVGYIFIGKNTAYANDSLPDLIKDTVKTEKNSWDNMIAAKKVTGGDLDLVVPKVIWTANTKYRQYDDTIPADELLSSNTSQNLKPMYVITTARDVYKCVSNAISSNGVTANSTIEPTGDYSTSNGNIEAVDGYVWKYMYNIGASNKFLNTDWMPAPTSVSQLGYGTDVSGVIDGELVSVIVTANGQNYREASNIVVNSFSSGQKYLNLSNTTIVREIFNITSLANLANMAISGTGLVAGTYITAISDANGYITISTATSTSGGGANTLNQISVSTRVYIDGDGTGAIANAILSNTSINATAPQANIASLKVTTIGKNYSYANAYIYGSGTGANTRVILPPKYGHAYNSAKELGANNVMVAVTIGEADSTEGGRISSNTNFRQFGLLINPHKYGENTSVTFANANTVMVQTSNVNVLSGASYLINEFVYQGTSANTAKAYGFVVDQQGNVIKISNKFGKFDVGAALIGANSGTQRTISSSNNPDLEPYSGDILYAENILSVDREDGQAENLKLVVRF